MTSKQKQSKQPQLEQSSGSKKSLIVGLIGGGVVLLLVLAVVMGTTVIGSEFGDPTIEGTGLPPMPPNNPVDVSATGLESPKVTGENFAGSEVVIDPADGRAKAIVFLAHWCPHCQAEVPLVQEWIDAGGGVDGVDMYAVATAMNSARGNFPPSAWLDNEGWTAPVLRDDNSNSVLRAFGSGGFPFWTFVNADGTVALRIAGRMPVDQLESIMQGLSQ
jgi:cytochrome c biogenesis protein CcmG/thiol:disulfide interchange protein DsbE